MAEGRSAPPEALKPWYYQYWFLYPVFVFWPVWAVLIIRSPWHNGLVSGAVAWAMLFVGGYYIGYFQLWQEGSLNDLTITLIGPGLALTLVTQALWLRDRKRVREFSARGEGEGPSTGSGRTVTDGGGSTSSPRTVGSRRTRRRRSRRGRR